MKHKLIKFDWVVNNLIVHKLLINHMNLIKESIPSQLLTGFYSSLKKKSEIIQENINEEGVLNWSFYLIRLSKMHVNTC